MEQLNQEQRQVIYDFSENVSLLVKQLHLGVSPVSQRFQKRLNECKNLRMNYSLRYDTTLPINENLKRSVVEAIVTYFDIQLDEEELKEQGLLNRILPPEGHQLYKEITGEPLAQVIDNVEPGSEA